MPPAPGRLPQRNGEIAFLKPRSDLSGPVVQREQDDALGTADPEALPGSGRL